MKFKNNDINTIPFFFIIGRPRTGTTLIRTLFDAHPNVVIPVESPIILNLYFKYKKEKNWTSEKLLNLYQDVIKQKHFDDWTIDKEKLKSDLLECGSKITLFEIFRIIYLNYKSFYKKDNIELIGDKNPYYSIHVKKLIKLFPNSKFLYISRDYRDNFYSLKRVDFEASNSALIAYRWKYTAREILKLKNKYPDKFYNFRYENFVNEPEKYFKEICDFLNLKYYPEVFDFYKKKENVFNIYKDPELIKIHENLMNPVNTGRIGLWKKKLSEREIKISDLVVGRYAELWGYEKRYKKFNIFLYLWILPVLIYGVLIYKLMLLGSYLPYKFNKWMLKKMSIFLKIYLKFFKK